jgi:hypothetical protein
MQQLWRTDIQREPQGNHEGGNAADHATEGVSEERLEKSCERRDESP